MLEIIGHENAGYRIVAAAPATYHPDDAHLAFVQGTNARGEGVTWVYNHVTNTFGLGRYFRTEEAAAEDYRQRVAAARKGESERHQELLRSVEDLLLG